MVQIKSGKFIDLTNIFKKYRGKWVAFDEKMKRVVSSGFSANQVFIKATQKGVSIPKLFKVPKRSVGYIG